MLQVTNFRVTPKMSRGRRKGISWLAQQLWDS